MQSVRQSVRRSDKKNSLAKIGMTKISLPRRYPIDLVRHSVPFFGKTGPFQRILGRFRGLSARLCGLTEFSALLMETPKPFL